jgi:2-phosphosulfolactate phosphatase
MQRTVVIDCFPESARAYAHGYVVVAVDVIRATTSAISVAATGGRCFPVATVEAALQLKAKLKNPLLAGERAGEIAPGFDMNNSPAELAARRDVSRPVILLSSSGTKLLHEASRCDTLYLACLRNWRYLATHLAGRHERVALIGAGTRGDFREEDQICCAWIARKLLAAGYEPENRETVGLVARWALEDPAAILVSKSVDFLRRTGQLKDLDFILSHINDLPMVFVQEAGEVFAVASSESIPTPGLGIPLTPGTRRIWPC